MLKPGSHGITAGSSLSEMSIWSWVWAQMHLMRTLLMRHRRHKAGVGGLRTFRDGKGKPLKTRCSVNPPRPRQRLGALVTHLLQELPLDNSSYHPVWSHVEPITTQIFLAQRYSFGLRIMSSIEKAYKIQQCVSFISAREWIIRVLWRSSCTNSFYLILWVKKWCIQEGYLLFGKQTQDHYHKFKVTLVYMGSPRPARTITSQDHVSKPWANMYKTQLMLVTNWTFTKHSFTQDY